MLLYFLISRPATDASAVIYIFVKFEGVTTPTKVKFWRIIFIFFIFWLAQILPVLFVEMTYFLVCVSVFFFYLFAWMVSRSSHSAVCSVVTGWQNKSVLQITRSENIRLIDHYSTLILQVSSLSSTPSMDYRYVLGRYSRRLWFSTNVMSISEMIFWQVTFILYIYFVCKSLIS